MNAVPPLRTSPTIKPSAAQNRQNLGAVRFSFSAVHIVMLLGLITGCMACAFYLGFYSGQNTGFEHALERALDNVPRVPLTGGEEEKVVEDEIAERVYARLGEQTVTLNADASADGTVLIPGETAESLRDKLANQGDAVAASAAAAREATEIAPDAGHLNEQRLGDLLNEDDKPVAPPHVEAAPLEAKAPAVSVVAKKESPRVAVTAVKVEQKKVEAPSAVDQSQFVRSVLPKGWYAQIAAPKQLEESHKIASRLKAAGFPVLIERANVRGEEYYRVMVGPEGSRQTGERLVKQLKREASLPNEPFIRMVK